MGDGTWGGHRESGFRDRRQEVGLGEGIVRAGCILLSLLLTGLPMEVGAQTRSSQTSLPQTLFSQTGPPESGGWARQDTGAQISGARIWFPRGPEPTVRRGEPVQVHFRADREAYVAIAQLDTSGRLSLHFPSGPRDPQWIRGGQDHLLLLAGGRPWVVVDDPGVGHFFILTADRPLDWSRLGYSRDRGWELSGAMAPAYTDPNDAMDDLVWAVLPQWQDADFHLGLASYRVVR